MALLPNRVEPLSIRVKLHELAVAYSARHSRFRGQLFKRVWVVIGDRVCVFVLQMPVSAMPVSMNDS